MKRPKAAKKGSADGPTELELLTFAQQTPLNQNELTLAMASLSQARLTQQTAKAYERIAHLLREQAIFARFHWQIFHEVCATRVSFPADAPDYIPPELMSWIRANVDGSRMISGREAARFLGWTRPTLIKIWDMFIPTDFKFGEEESYSESFLRRLAALRDEDERKRKAERQKELRARKKPTQEKSEKL